ncbi:hypothetical protein SAMD00023353_11800180 [Rosellinia necatrix]|uniref:Uncharacterized protein n=1 Tax=Rosellinia necatrix TaxID=77044 RepID=A0A1S8AB94_ROSNE|nr:hypothetical protein SAMD00023353_11800180 [Rosellinia necatrix]
MSSESRNEGGQSPPPERQTGRQIHETPASGQGTDTADNKEEVNREQLKNLTSNPPGPMDASLGEKFAKGFAKK